MNVQAKFQLVEINHRQTHNPDDVNVGFVFQAVYANGEANKDWSKYTPNGELKMTVTNPEAIKQFELGADYILTFEKS